MSLHIALLEPLAAPVLGAIARECVQADAPLHVVGPLPFAREDEAFRKAGPDDPAALDWWVHEGWRDFRDAMARERCLYFAADGERDAAEAPFRKNSVLVVGNAAGELPERIRAKYPNRIYRLPQPPRRKTVDLGASVGLLLALGAERIAAAATPMAPPKPTAYGRGRGRR
jgi:tRNA(Leu) C34 or U34 (ribose-2'-O)-methylase TrmL